MTIKAGLFEPYGLTNLDHTIPPCYVRFTAVFPVSNIPLGVESLQRGADLLTSEFPFLTGCVIPNRNPGARKGALQIEPDDHYAGILQVKQHASSYDTGSTIAEERYLPLPFFADSNTPAPIIRLQVNAMTDGIILGIAFNHQVVDGTAMGVLIRDFARCCILAGGSSVPSTSGLETNLERQVEGRAILSASGLEKTPLLSHPKIDHSAEYPVVAPLPADRKALTQAMQLSARSLTMQRFLIPTNKLQSLVNVCNDWLAKSSEFSEERPWVSKNDVVVSLFWMCFKRAQEYGPSGKATTVTSQHTDAPSMTRISMAVNVRGRTIPPTPPAYIGNAVVPLLESVSMDLILGNHSPLATSSGEEHTCKDKKIIHSLSHMAYAIRKKLHHIDDAFVRSVISHLEGVSDLSTICIGQSDFNISSWRDMGICTADYGPYLGHPVDVVIAKGMIDGQFYILPRKGHDGDGEDFWEIEATLRTETLERLCADEILSSYARRIPQQP